MNTVYPYGNNTAILLAAQWQKHRNKQVVIRMDILISVKVLVLANLVADHCSISEGLTVLAKPSFCY